MIRPEEYEAAITNVRLMCGLSFNNRQYTFAELIVQDRTDKEIQVSFYIPKNTCPRDESALLNVLGVSAIVNEAMDCWDRRIELSTVPNHRVSARIAPVDSSLSAEVSGCSDLAVVAVPRGPCVVSCCWSHLISSDKLFVPTQNENISSWRHEVIVMQGEVESHGRKATRSLGRSFRFDLASSQCQVNFMPCDNATLIRRMGPSLPFHNLWIPMSRNSIDGRLHNSICGSVLCDLTQKRLVNFYEVMFTAVPVVCGCFVRNTVSFPNSYVPLSVTERVTRDAPLTFEDSPDGSNNVIVTLHNAPMYRINLEERESYSGINWVKLSLLV